MADLSPETEKTTQGKKEEGKLICPNCKLLYEKMTFCIRCGSTLVKELPSQPQEPNPPTAPEVKTEGAKPEPGRPRIQDKGFKAAYSPPFQTVSPKPPYGTEIKKESPAIQAQSSQRRPIERFPKDTGKPASTPFKEKKRFLRLGYEVFSVLFLVGVGVVLVWSIYSHFATKGPISNSSPSFKGTDPMPRNASRPALQTSTAGEPRVEEQPTQGLSKDESQEMEAIKALLEKVRQANLEKNIELFMSCYSADFRDRGGKKRTTLESWENFNYMDLSYGVTKPSILADTATARVEWSMNISSKTDSQPQLSNTVLDVTFKKEKGGWKIKETKPAN